MNRKVIKSILRKKFNEWVSTINNESIRKLIEEVSRCVKSKKINIKNSRKFLERLNELTNKEKDYIEKVKLLLNLERLWN